ncbi:membrane protein insertion efficiency factor YidD [Candidatus Saccharibacteria bacterium]|nr:membrane protein insertion efficiency factor YidD [Candidatus Saccharibacteria bacterium]
MKNILVVSINAYQKTLSPDHGILKARYPYGFCRHYPSCSEYTKLAIQENGSLKGTLLGVKHVARCNPFVQPSVDLSYKKGTN